MASCQRRVVPACTASCTSGAPSAAAHRVVRRVAPSRAASCGVARRRAPAWGGEMAIANGEIGVVCFLFDPRPILGIGECCSQYPEYPSSGRTASTHESIAKGVASPRTCPGKNKSITPWARAGAPWARPTQKGQVAPHAVHFASRRRAAWPGALGAVLGGKMLCYVMLRVGC